MCHLFGRVFIALMVCLTFAGCGGPEGPTLVPVSGKVLLDGEPVAGALVQFIPTSGPSSGGQTDDNGEFTLTGPGNRPGAVVGSFTVTVGCPFNPSQGSSSDGSTEAPESTVTCSVPDKYSDLATSDVHAEIPDEGKSDLVVELTSE